MEDKQVVAEYNANDKLIAFLFINALAHSSKLEENLELCKELLKREDFIDILKDYIKYLDYTNLFSEQALTNIRTIINKNRNLFSLDKIISCLDQLDKINDLSNDIYMIEFQYRFDSLEIFRETETQIIYKDKLEEILFFDGIVLSALSSSRTQFVEYYLEGLILNKNFIYSINKFRHMIPDILEDKNIKQRVLDIIDINIKALQEPDDFTKQQYYQNNCDSNIIYIESLEQFKKENELLKENIVSNQRPFLFQNFRNYYQFLCLEAYLYEGVEDKKNIISLSAIYAYIDSIIDGHEIELQFDKVTKQKLVDLLNAKKEQAIDKHQYNSHLIKLNKLQPRDRCLYEYLEYDNKVDLKVRVLNHLKSKKRRDNYIRKIADTGRFDFFNFTSFIMPEHFFKNHVAKFSDTYYPYAIKKYLNENQEIFKDKENVERAIQVLKQYDDATSRKLIKKLKRYN